MALLASGVRCLTLPCCPLAEACSYDYEGSWRIGLAAGPSPLNLSVSRRPAITCATVQPQRVSLVADPFLYIPLLDGRCLISM